MELVVRKNDLLRELHLLQGIVERKNTVPVLANVLMEADGDELRLAATDIEVGLRSRCQASVSKGGSLTVPAKKLYEVVKALPDTDVRIERDRSGVKIAADRFESRMPTLPTEEFPTLPEPPGVAAQVLPPKLLHAMIGMTQFAITAEDTRFYLNGALLVLAPGSLTLVGTDGHRLAHVTAKRAEGAADSGETRIILPRKLLSELSRLLAEEEADVSFQQSENHLFFEIGGRTLFSRVVDAQFPAYERVIPKGNDKHIDFDRDRLSNAVRRVALLSNERSRAVKFDIGEGRVEITSNSQEFGEAREQLSVDYSQPQMQICFNAQYVLDFLGAVPSDTVVLEFKDEMSQAVMKPAAMEDVDYLYVLMPMRL